MSRIVCFLLLLFLQLFSSLAAQNSLIVQNDSLKEKYKIQEGDYVKIFYAGYLNQLAEQKSHIKNISESILLFNTTKSKDLIDDDWNVRIADIKGIKKLWKYELIARPVITLGMSLGAYFYFDTDNYSTDQQYVYTSLVGIGTGLLLNIIFNDTIEHKVSNGWTIRFSYK